MLPRAFPALRASDGGVVVNFSSVAGQRGRANRAPYSAAKGGIEAATRTMAIEWAPHNIRVNAVVPGGSTPGSTGRTSRAAIRAPKAC
jgi:NAD(P)-dependent dehydrogenase (short-subunit alcohol dehydrogenase family)